MPDFKTQLEEFKLFGRFGSEAQRTDLVAYMEAICSNKPYEGGELSEHLTGPIKEVLDTPGLQEYMLGHADFQNYVLLEIIQQLDAKSVHNIERGIKRHNRWKRVSSEVWYKFLEFLNHIFASSVFDMNHRVLGTIEVKKLKGKITKKGDFTKNTNSLIQTLRQNLIPHWSSESGQWKDVPFDLLAKYESQMQNHKALDELVANLGRMDRAMTQSTFKEVEETEIPSLVKNPIKDKEEIKGITQGDDLPYVLPGEIALLGQPETEDLFYQRFVEKKLLEFDLIADANNDANNKKKAPKSKSEDGKGPIILCVDTSASMMGKVEEAAKVICLAMMKRALVDHRPCYVVAFSQKIEVLELSGVSDEIEVLLQFLSMSFHGGTDVGEALNASLELMKNQKFHKADMIMLTDGKIPMIDPGLRSRLLNAKTRGNRFFSIIIAGTAYENVHFPSFTANWRYNPMNGDGFQHMVEELRKL
ncbi:VWA domain-containing protein [Persicobacter psychrovividus]|uniref:VWFA domain-containing protein n=1 Tax=Persicobacter psychrovividus TaxID=387638 RepID=A0ABN6L6T7_9BACT|nr:hypothetical protein PEPS_11660 [Persicobacter psychrovividus]